MSDHLHDAGKRFLSLLSRHSGLVMDTYLAGTAEVTPDNAKAVDKLVQNGILKRSEPNEPLRLARPVRQLLEDALKDERNRQVDANVGSALATLKTLAGHYKEALHLHDYPAADVHLQELQEQVFGLKESLRYSTRSLWSRINNEFGYVGTIEAKIRENRLAQDQVIELLASLELFRFDELAELAGDARELRRLLVVGLQHTLVDCTQEMAVVQSRLLALLGRFREIQGRTRLLKGFLLHCEQHPDYKVGPHLERVQVPSLFNQADALLAPASVDVTQGDEEHTLLQLVSQIRRPEREAADARLAHGEAFELGQVADYTLSDDGLKQDVDRFYCAAIDRAEPLSALQYLQQQSLSWPEEAWLYQVIGAFDSLPKEQQDCFALDPTLQDHPVFSGNKYIEDVRVALR
ncbi:phosphoenolpyruvate carboxylase [Ferrimonas balearica]|uniref:phosphoenolpyruvate carboxylase n=1 Tax=Ferrimonas balearica TaxID=44012 RepID=UPI001C58CEB6|nr:phosphoenolpyruvate carboxylase [Ferrimonas balearica]MBW3163667.1 phosphoenolpyruvate carboxylase [Ferrimonas balearica]MBY5979520.1 phosphoenolpyruvate carboxylase [Ferrimonas balearica]MBY6105788.1 phosphoenolpyruvate carboxylase [Ferrimonas balearica]MBY6223670.1 phosphoenolpyruvate carboxylase [Ferrimonas balearica]